MCLQETALILILLQHIYHSNPIDTKKIYTEISVSTFKYHVDKAFTLALLFHNGHNIICKLDCPSLIVCFPLGDTARVGIVYSDSESGVSGTGRGRTGIV